MHACQVCGTNRGPWIRPDWCRGCWQEGKRPVGIPPAEAEPLFIIESPFLRKRMFAQERWDDITWEYVDYWVRWEELGEGGRRAKQLPGAA